MRITFTLDNPENRQSLVVQRIDDDELTITIVSEDGQFDLAPHERFKLIDALLSMGK